MSIEAAYIFPHPPLIFPEVGKGEENQISATIEAMREASAEIAKLLPDTVVIVSPHAQAYSDYFHVSPNADAYGGMEKYGVYNLKISTTYDQAFAAALENICARDQFPAGTKGERDPRLDHGTMIALRFIQEAGLPDVRCVRIGISGLSVAEHYRMGMYIQQTAEELNRRVVFIASGDLSHKLAAGGPYGFAPEGPQFDEDITKAMETADFMSFLTMQPLLCEKAAECGHKPFCFMAGALDGLTVEPKLLSHEWPFGVGYDVASFKVTGASDSRKFLEPFLEAQRSKVEETRKAESELAHLARETVESYVTEHKMPPEPLLTSLTSRAAGVFVSIKKGGSLRGCIGTIAPVQPNIADEIRHNAVEAAEVDPRFNAVSPGELPYLTYSVDVLAPTEDIESDDELDPKKYGVVVTMGNRRGLLLPDLEGVTDVDSQISIAMQKAGISPNDRPNVKLQRFEVVRYK
jgi:AmmeMemoRadiSam system protein A